ncbi:MAG: hypothetical protein LBT55_00900 [Clostridiaceae bacterium]|jgi:glutamate racemase|nr:hypothetical protein [Clostridiaceae bacterium]
MRIGVFDSGIGGLTVLAEIIRRVPFGDCLYYADNKNAPFGEKSADKITEYLDSALKFFKADGADAAVIACNTLSMLAEPFKSRFPFKIITTLPPVEKSENPQKTLLLATPFTVSALTEKGLPEGLKAYGIPEIVPLLERAAPDFTRAYPLLRKFLPKDCGFTEVILGCTHYPYFKCLAKTLYPCARITDGGLDAAEKLLSVARGKAKPEKFPEIRFCFTGADKTALYGEILNRLLAENE